MKNKGYFKFTNEFVLNSWNDIYIIFKDFRPIHIEFRHWENDVWYYYGVSNMFDNIKEGEEVPQYNILVTTEVNKVTYKFEKV